MNIIAITFVNVLARIGMKHIRQSDGWAIREVSSGVSLEHPERGRYLVSGEPYVAELEAQPEPAREVPAVEPAAPTLPSPSETKRGRR